MVEFLRELEISCFGGLEMQNFGRTENIELQEGQKYLNTFEYLKGNLAGSAASSKETRASGSQATRASSTRLSSRLTI